MHVGFKDNIVTALMKRINEGEKYGKTVDYIAVTHQEHRELMALYYRGAAPYTSVFASTHPVHGALDPTMAFEVREFPRRRTSSYAYTQPPYIRVPQEGFFSGHPLFVVPDECSLS